MFGGLGWEELALAFGLALAIAIGVVWGIKQL